MYIRCDLAEPVTPWSFIQVTNSPSNWKSLLSFSFGTKRTSKVYLENQIKRQINKGYKRIKNIKADGAREVGDSLRAEAR